ncbi:SET domain-containing protein-lysine N-methyltransferase [Flavobacterium gelidilacus]|uniref:SET domain-containing protein-lysine N-methyltransferase n=1 Tax=Flavobacterium gelidilacus TaxID=206041 RepID=UPI000425B9BF|nr:SET domain-containing protein-lysine N-methyltransferase [Flavobacterium gelidilacus]
MVTLFLLTNKLNILNNLSLKIDAPESDYLYIENSQIINAGKGLFTTIEIYKYEVISIFKGEILTEIEAENRVQNDNDKYFINMIDGTIMDSMHIDCFAKYANDAEAFENSEFKNNAKITLDDDDNVCIMSTKNIKSKSEIFCSYGKRYWKKHI